MSYMRAVIMAGGRGTRIAELFPDIPKPMIPVEGKPILQRQIECLVRQGVEDIMLVTGYLDEHIREYFQDGSRFGVRLKYFHEEVPLGTAGALTSSCPDEDFLLINGDVLFDMNLHRLMAFHKSKGAFATLTVHPNKHPYDSALVITDARDRVTGWLHKDEPRGYYRNRVNAGIHVLSPQIFEGHPRGKLDLDRDVLKPLIPSGKVFAYHTPEYISDVGTPERYREVCDSVMHGRPVARSLNSRRRAVFLDRDGVLNRENGFIRRPEQLELLPGVAEAIRTINESDYLAIVITNQPVIARGDCTVKELDEIHCRLETLLGQHGAYIDDLFYCPHHPERGFPGERLEYKIECDCRKPKPGLLLRAAERYNIDLAASYMVGDGERDVGAALAAGVKPILLGQDYPNLYEFAKEEIMQ